MSQILSEYKLVSQLANKKASTLYLAQSLTTPGDEVVIKVFNTVQFTDRQSLEDFVQEVAFLQQLDHQHILPILNVGVERQHPYLISAHIPRQSLRSRLGTSPLPLEEALSIITQTGQALAYAHAWDVLHANVKPENILFDEQGEALLTDFTLFSLLEHHATHYRPDTRSAAYMAPERFTGAIGQESDQYALGCIAYELLAGQPPFSAASLTTWKTKHTTERPTSLNELAPNIPARVVAGIHRALAKDPDARYQSVLAFVEALWVPGVQRGGRAYSVIDEEADDEAIFEADRVEDTDALEDESILEADHVEDDALLDPDHYENEVVEQIAPLQQVPETLEEPSTLSETSTPIVEAPPTPLKRSRDTLKLPVVTPDQLMEGSKRSRETLKLPVITPDQLMERQRESDPRSAKSSAPLSDAEPSTLASPAASNADVHSIGTDGYTDREKTLPFSNPFDETVVWPSNDEALNASSASSSAAYDQAGTVEEVWSPIDLAKAPLSPTSEASDIWAEGDQATYAANTPLSKQFTYPSMPTVTLLIPKDQTSITRQTRAVVAPSTYRRKKSPHLALFAVPIASITMIAIMVAPILFMPAHQPAPDNKQNIASNGTPTGGTIPQTATLPGTSTLTIATPNQATPPTPTPTTTPVPAVPPPLAILPP